MPVFRTKKVKHQLMPFKVNRFNATVQKADPVEKPQVEKTQIEKPQTEKVQKPKAAPKTENKTEPKIDDMDTKDKIALAEQVLGSKQSPNVKILKKDNGLFERVDTPQIILTEDNRELLRD